MLAFYTIWYWLRNNQGMIYSGILWAVFTNAFITVVTWSVTFGADIRSLGISLLVTLPPGTLFGCLAGVLTIWIQNKYSIQNKRSREIILSALVIAFSVLGALGGLFVTVLTVVNLAPTVTGPAVLLIGWIAWFAGAAVVEGLIAVAVIVVFQLTKRIRGG